ncbi:MAG: hypothetical protein GWN79_28155, partial [Actinobacteria bacterium]|nr:hypothetical protein [Actinomycetota bacterium]NIS37048.1 hypothetical protein [Actinomycetota bacterium]NIT99066.1 hypothetical protein [Actinomycetota bacterium]NIU22677.1 hypothetical protein [Actinomycetota bacterium]NIU71521.1 hypothetical protein [Actinomycetota bacterium]
RSDPVTGPPSGPLTGPLTGIRILELSQIVSGPLAVQLLAEQGAEVTKVEPVAGDLLRIRQPEVIPPLHANNNRGKRSIAIDMSHPAGLGIVLDLAEGIDVFVENFRPGVCERIGLGEAAVRERGRPTSSTSRSADSGPTGPTPIERCSIRSSRASPAWSTVSAARRCPSPTSCGPSWPTRPPPTPRPRPSPPPSTPVRRVPAVSTWRSPCSTPPSRGSGSTA